jgi:hypothetical protein
MKITFWDFKPGDQITFPDRARNTYEITSKSEKKVCLRRVKDGFEHCMETDRFLKHLNSDTAVNPHLVPQV